MRRRAIYLVMACAVASAGAAGAAILAAPGTVAASHPASPSGTQQWGGGCGGICSSHDKPLCYCCDTEDCDGAH